MKLLQHDITKTLIPLFQEMYNVKVDKIFVKQLAEDEHYDKADKQL